MGKVYGLTGGLGKAYRVHRILYGWTGFDRTLTT